MWCRLRNQTKKIHQMPGFLVHWQRIRSNPKDFSQAVVFGLTFLSYSLNHAARKALSNVNNKQTRICLRCRFYRFFFLSFSRIMLLRISYDSSFVLNIYINVNIYLGETWFASIDGLLGRVFGRSRHAVSRVVRRRLIHLWLGQWSSERQESARLWLAAQRRCDGAVWYRGTAVDQHSFRGVLCDRLVRQRLRTVVGLAVEHQNHGQLVRRLASRCSIWHLECMCIDRQHSRWIHWFRFFTSWYEKILSCCQFISHFFQFNPKGLPWQAVIVSR